MPPPAPPSVSPPFPTVRLAGQPVHAATEAQVVRHILDALAAGRGGWVVTHNLDHLRRLLTDPEFARLCATADLRTADGAPLIWAAKVRGTPLPGRVAGSDLTPVLCRAAEAEGRSVFLLGGNPGTADLAATKLRERHPNLKVAGTLCPPFGYEQDPAQLDAIAAAVAAAAPDIVFVALGSPKQELLAVRLLEAVPRAWFLGVGISLSFLTGEVRRAPRWMRATGLEWVHRLSQEPRRLARRYLVDGIPFALRLLARSLADRLTGRAARGE